MLCKRYEIFIFEPTVNARSQENMSKRYSAPLFNIMALPDFVG